MSLFPLLPDPAVNLLPFDGVVNDYGVLLPPAEADVFLRTLLAEVPWRHDEVRLFGRRITTARQVAWYGDEAYVYGYSGVARSALPWSPPLLALKARVEAALNASFNSCLLNLYRDGSEGMAWHSDDEAVLGRESLIASLSFGAARRFAFLHKVSGEKRELWLAYGQLLVMRGETQRFWRHALLKSARVRAPRISLTFRRFFFCCLGKLLFMRRTVDEFIRRFVLRVSCFCYQCREFLCRVARAGW